MNYANFIRYRSLVKSQWYFEKSNSSKTRCRVCLAHAMCIDDIQAWGKRPLLTCSRNAGGWYKLLQIIEKLSSYVSLSFVTFWGCDQSKEALQDHWLVDYSTVSAFGAYAIVTKMQAVQVGIRKQSFRRARGQARVWIHLYILHHRIRAIVQTEDSRMPYQRNYSYIVSFVIYHRKILVLISLFDHILKQVVNMLLYAYYVHLSYYI